MSNGWIGVDLDGTLAYYDVWRGIEHIGKPIPAMVERVKRWLADGHTVKIFTARVTHGTRNATEAMLAKLYIQQWLTDVAGLPALEVTNVKDFGMFTLWDDRCMQVVMNTGTPVLGEDITAISTVEYHRLYEIDRRMPKSAPTITREANGPLTLDWPEGETHALISKELLESMIEHFNSTVR